MHIESLADSLHMRFSAPKIENEPEKWTMKNLYNSWAYRVQYWKNGTSEKVSLAVERVSDVGTHVLLGSVGHDNRKSHAEAGVMYPWGKGLLCKCDNQNLDSPTPK